MIEIELSTIPDSEFDTRLLTTLVEEFGRERGVQVKLRIMTWGNAWTELMTIASHARGPHISHIGGTWTSSLIMMNALRPFSEKEIAEVGGASAFMRPTWLSAMLHGEEKVYAIPWTGYIYVICYRKDLLAQAGIEESTAFGSIEALHATIQRLSASSLEIPWLNPLIVPPYTDYLHTAASWIWGAGGNFVDKTGKQLVFDSPEALRGVAFWLDTYRAVPPAYAGHGSAEGIALFAEGKAAATLTDIRVADSFAAGEAAPIVRENLGVATLTNAPWCGGANFVIWNHTRGMPEQERAAVALVQFLANSQNQLRWAREVQSMPARLDVLEQVYAPGHPLRESVFWAARDGQPYPSIPLWRRVEYQLAQAMGAMVEESRADLQKPSIEIVRDQLAPLARRLNLAFNG